MSEKDGPDDIVDEEGTPLFLAAAFTPEEAADERGLTLAEAEITEEWQRFRNLTDAEKADPEKVHDIFMGGIDPDLAYGRSRRRYEGSCRTCPQLDP